MQKEKILVIGASGQIGVELTLALRNIYGNNNVIASDLREENDLLKGTGPYVSLDVMNKEMLHVQVIRQNITQIYLLAAILSATGEKNPNLAWSLNMQSLLNVLDIAREEKLHKVYWPSSIAVFGPTTPRENTPQYTMAKIFFLFFQLSLSSKHEKENSYSNPKQRQGFFRLLPIVMLPSNKHR